MRDTSFHEFRTERHKSFTLIEAECVGLRVQNNVLEAALTCSFDQRAKDRRADPLATPLRLNRHAADMPVGQQSARTDCAAVLRCVRKRVIAGGIVLVHFELSRNVLLDDEYLRSDHLGLRPSARPIENANRPSR